MVRIQNKAYYKKNMYTQNELVSSDPQLMHEKLVDYQYIPLEHVANISKGIWVRYVSEQGKYRCGGRVVHNGSPDYIVLRNPFTNVCWSVNLKYNKIFVRGTLNKL